MIIKKYKWSPFCAKDLGNLSNKILNLRVLSLYLVEYPSKNIHYKEF